MIEKLFNIILSHDDYGISEEEARTMKDELKEACILLSAKEEHRLVVLPVPSNTKVFRLVKISPVHDCSEEQETISIRKGVIQFDDVQNWMKTVFPSRDMAKKAIAKIKSSSCVK